MIPMYQLTEREREVIGYLADGDTYAEAAHKVYRGESTIKADILRVRKTVGARNIAHLIALVMRTGQLP